MLRRCEWPRSAIYLALCWCLLWRVDQTPPSPFEKNGNAEKSSYVPPDPDLDAIWRLAVGLDLGSRSVLEAEVLMWRICNAKSMPRKAIERALNEEWENDKSL